MKGRKAAKCIVILCLLLIFICQARFVISDYQINIIEYQLFSFGGEILEFV